MSEPLVEVRRIRKATEQVADQLRALVLSGDLATGDKLPTEQLLAAQFGVSRATVREALATLASEGFLRTSKGPSGGRFVITPSPDRVSNALSLAVTLLSQENQVTLDELLEFREYLEIPAARLAAARRSEGEVDQLHRAIPDAPHELSQGKQFATNRDFHRCLLDASHNTLIVIAAEPVFSALQTRIARSGLETGFHSAITEQHRHIAEAIEAGDADAAEAHMRAHLDWLRPKYEEIWTEGRPA